MKVDDLVPVMLEAFEQNLSFTFPIAGTSMQPLLHTGDAVKLVKTDKYQKGDIVFYLRDNGQYILHRIRRVHKKNNSYDMVGDHQTALEKGVKYNQLIGVVQSYTLKKNQKEYSLTRFKYKIYKFIIKSKIIRKLLQVLL